MGFDAVTETFVDLYETGVIDPTKVTRNALCHGASLAGLLLTADVRLTDAPPESTTGERPELETQLA